MFGKSDQKAAVQPNQKPELHLELNETKQKQDPHSNLAKKYQLFLFGSRFEAAQ